MRVQDAKHIKDIKGGIELKMNKNLRGQEKKYINDSQDLIRSGNFKNSFLNLNNKTEEINNEEINSKNSVNITDSSSFHVIIDNNKNSNVKLCKKKFAHNLHTENDIKNTDLDGSGDQNN